MNFKFNYNYIANFPIFKIIFSILLGIIITICVTQKNSLFKKIIHKKTKLLFEQNLACNADFDIEKIDLFNCIFCLKNLNVKPINRLEQWSWQCDKITINFDWLYLLINQKLNIKIKIKSIIVNSQYQNQKIAISDHLYQLLLAPGPIPIELAGIDIKNGKFNLFTPQTNLKTQVWWSSKSKNIFNILKSNIYVKNALINDVKNIYLENLSGQIQLNLPFDSIEKLNGNCELNFKLPILDGDDKYFISGKWLQSAGSCKLNSINDSITLNPITLISKNKTWLIDAKGHVKIDILQRLNPLNISGKSTIDLSACIYEQDYTVAGSCMTENLAVNQNILFDQAKFTFNRDHFTWRGQINLAKANIFDFMGKWQWHELNKTGKCHIHNINNINLQINKNWEINPKDANLCFTFKNLTNQPVLNANYNLTFNNYKTDLNKQITGHLNYKADQLIFDGNIKHNYHQQLISQDSYQAAFSTTTPYLQNFRISNEKNAKPYVYIQNHNNQITTNLDLESIHNWLPKELQAFCSGQGEVIIESNFNQNKIFNKISMLNGNIVLPKIYNIIKNLHGEFIINLQNKSLKIKNAKIQLHKGQIKVQQANIKRDYIYLPVIFDSLTINFERNLVANLSGKISYQKKANQLDHIKGLISIEQGICKYNLFAPDFLNKFETTGLSYLKTKTNFNLDLHVFTRAPIKIKSEFLQTSINSQIQIAGTTLVPQVIGEIKILGGKINFPYKPLFINSGQIYFTKEQPDSPMIDLTAKNQIKRYDITMHLSGSIINPYIILESSPSLTEEQIGTLLLLGTENTTLNMIMPAIMMQNINSIIFGSIYDEEQTSSLLKKLFKPLDHVRFVPSFSDETGRGGLKGAVEIDVNDRLRASIQKNFSLTEDTKLEIDYAITDDVSVRLIKDERGDLGGEFEIRLKL